jgi:hypothetical protein
MSIERLQTDAEALREMAERILTDDVDIQRLDAYMRELLEARLVELPAVCRREAALLCRSFRRLGSVQLSMLLRQTAEQLERK